VARGGIALIDFASLRSAKSMVAKGAIEPVCREASMV
jgi:hypothetical protein